MEEHILGMRWANPGINACYANACVNAMARCVKDLRWVSGAECWVQQLLAEVRQLSIQGNYSIIECPLATCSHTLASDP